MAKLSGWRYGVFISGMVGAITLALYPIVISPMMDVEKYKRIQEITRAGINQETIQPGNMKVWTDPFASKKADK